MTRQEWLMAQMDLEPIESHGSMEMSTAKFTSLQKRNMLANSGVQLEKPLDTHNSSSKKTAAPSFESKATTTFLDVTESKMRNFIMD